MRILIVRLSAIGDIVMASGVLPPLRQFHPGARVSWLTQPECAPLLQDHPDIDEVLVWPRARWQDLWRKRQWGALQREVRTFRKELLTRDFDLAIDLQGLLKSGFLTWLSGARRRIGLGSREGSRWLLDQSLDRAAAGDVLIGSEYRSALKQLGIDPGAFRMNIGIGAAARQSAKEKLSAMGSTGVDLVICPFTTRPQKHWREGHWVDLCMRLAQRGRQVLVLGGPADREAGERLAKASGATNLTGNTSLQEAAAIIQQARGLIGVDTGLTHMGHAFRIPTLSLFGSTRPYLDPDNPSGAVIYLNKDCAPCRRHPTCGGSFHCMGDILPEQVEAALFALLVPNP